MIQSRREFVRTLFVATQAAAIGGMFPQQTFSSETSNKNPLNFLLLGDWGRMGGHGQQQVADQMTAAAKDVDAKFIISVGDNFYEDGVASIHDAHWQGSFENIYSAPALQVPWWAILGNHDYHGNCDAQIEYHKISSRWNMPARYFQRTENIDEKTAVDFFYLDTTPMAELDADEMKYHGHVKSQDVPAQMAWFEAALKNSTAPWKIVIGHHPVYSGGIHGDTPYLIKHVLPLLEKYRVQAYFNGHDHDLQHLQAGSVNLFCTGGGSKPRDLVSHTPRTKFGKGTSGFIVASLGAEKLAVRMINDKGRQLYSATVPRTA